MVCAERIACRTSNHLPRHSFWELQGRLLGREPCVLSNLLVSVSQISTMQYIVNSLLELGFLIVHDREDIKMGQLFDNTPFWSDTDTAPHGGGSNSPIDVT